MASGISIPVTVNIADISINISKDIATPGFIKGYIFSVDFEGFIEVPHLIIIPGHMIQRAAHQGRVAD